MIVEVDKELMYLEHNISAFISREILIRAG